MQCKFDGHAHGDGHSDGEGTYKQALTVEKTEVRLLVCNNDHTDASQKIAAQCEQYIGHSRNQSEYKRVLTITAEYYLHLLNILNISS